jgi:hypothetical protein
MGCWTRALGRLTVSPQPDNKLLTDFYEFNKTYWPEEYKRADEWFENTWFFDKDNRLVCCAGKFFEPDIWYKHMRDQFFDPRRYKLIGDLDIIGEGEAEGNEIWDQTIEDEYQEWKTRVSKIKRDADY